MSKLNIFYEEIKVGELHRSEDLIYSFTYEKKWLTHDEAFPLSLALPLQKEAFGNKSTLSFFENLIPEGEVRDSIGRSHHIESPFEFLKEFGQDCAGAVIVSEQENSPFKNTEAETKKIELDMDKIYSAIKKNQSVVNLIADMNPGYLSLAGAQDKFPAIYEKGKFYLPQKGRPTTHIIKVPVHHHGIKESVHNEYYCMKLASAIGFNIPPCQVVTNENRNEKGKEKESKIENQALFVIERYDRIKDAKNRIHRIHQQDFCQAQAFISEQKYEFKGGPTIKNNYELIVNNIGIKNRVPSTYLFIDWLVFNLLIGNNDCHSKNISFLLKGGTLEIAPFYDLLCTEIYPKLKRQFPFMIGGRNDTSRIGKNQFDLLDQELGLKTGSISERMQMMIIKVLNKKDEVAEEISSQHKDIKIPNRISKIIGNKVLGFRKQGLN